MKYYYTRKEVSKWLKENKILNYKEIDEVLLKKDKWIINRDTKYFYVNYKGKVDWIFYSNDKIDEWNIKTGNCFKTEKEAKVYKQKLIDLGKTS